jgi:hypothetical protein
MDRPAAATRKPHVATFCLMRVTIAQSASHLSLAMAAGIQARRVQGTSAVSVSQDCDDVKVKGATQFGGTQLLPPLPNPLLHAFLPRAPTAVPRAPVRLLPLYMSCLSRCLGKTYSSLYSRGCPSSFKFGYRITWNNLEELNL